MPLQLQERPSFYLQLSLGKAGFTLSSRQQDLRAWEAGKEVLGGDPITVGNQIEGTLLPTLVHFPGNVGLHTPLCFISYC